MSGGGSIEDDVIVLPGVISEQKGELVERGDLGGAGARELLADDGKILVVRTRFHLRQHPLPVGFRSLLGINVQHIQPWRPRDRHRRVAQFDAEDLVEVRSRVGAHQQHRISGVCKRQRRGRSQGRFFRRRPCR